MVRRTARVWPVLRPVAGLCLAVLAWWAVVAVLDIRPLFLPGPAAVVEAATRHWSYLVGAAWSTLGHTLAGFGLAGVAGLVTALVLAVSRPVREAALPVLVGLQAVPKVALAPLFIIWLGFGPQSKVALVGLLCFFPVVVSSLAGLRSTPAELVELARSLSAGRCRAYLTIRLPYAAPQVFTGLKVAVSLALIGAVVAQITTPNSGLGAVIVLAGQAADTPLAFAAIGLLAGIGIGLYYGLVALERLLLPWATAAGG